MRYLISHGSVVVEPGGNGSHTPPRQSLSPEWSTLRGKTEDSVSTDLLSALCVEWLFPLSPISTKK